MEVTRGSHPLHHQYIEFVVCTKSSKKGEKATRTAKESGWKQGKLDNGKLQRFLEDAMLA